MRAHVRKMSVKIYFEIQFWLLGNKNVYVLCCVCNDVTCSRNDCHFFSTDNCYTIECKFDLSSVFVFVLA